MNPSIAFISDIHGNAHALSAVLDDIAGRGITETICLGDVVGYGGSPGDCIDLVRAKTCACILGNHDAMVAGDGGRESLSEETRASIEWTQDVLSADQKAWLQTLPDRFESVDFVAAHASLHNPNAWPYVLIADAARQSFAHQNQPACFIGHTHQPAFWVEGEERGVDITSLENLRPGRKCLINVGSVGQPRDHDERACYAVYRRETQDILWRRVDYNIAGAQTAILKAGLPAKFARRLEWGK
jgi:diadenosine tetraphosphatase ApaH/serine/threonine PP2A family protein phosphatase